MGSGFPVSQTFCCAQSILKLFHQNFSFVTLIPVCISLYHPICPYVSYFYLQVGFPFQCFSLQRATVGSTVQANLDWDVLEWCEWMHDWYNGALELEGG